MAIEWALNISILENTSFQILFILMLGYLYFILFLGKLVQYLSRNDKRILK